MKSLAVAIYAALMAATAGSVSAHDTRYVFPSERASVELPCEALEDPPRFGQIDEVVACERDGVMFISTVRTASGALGNDASSDFDQLLADARSDGRTDAVVEFTQNGARAFRAEIEQQSFFKIMVVELGAEVALLNVAMQNQQEPLSESQIAEAIRLTDTFFAKTEVIAK